MPHLVDTKSLYYNIKSCYKVQDYESVISLAKSYVAIPNVYIPYNLWFYYGLSSFKTGLIKEGIEAFIQAYNEGAPSVLKVKMAREMRAHNLFNEPIKFLESAISDPEYQEDLGYYLLGKTEFYLGNNERALSLLNKGLTLAKDKQARSRFKSLIEKVRRNINNQTKKIDCNAYLASGKAIKPGTVVYLKQNCNHPISNFNLPIFNRSSYLIFYSDDEFFYAFPLTSNPENGYKSIPVYSNKDKYLFPRLVFFKKEDIDVILDAGETIYPKIIKSYYQNIQYKKEEYRTIEDNFVLGALSSDFLPNIHDIVIIFDPYTRIYHYLFILDINDSYQAVELEMASGIFTPTTSILKLSLDTIFFDRIPLTKEAKTRILNNMPELIPSDARS